VIGCDDVSDSPRTIFALLTWCRTGNPLYSTGPHQDWARAIGTPTNVGGDPSAAHSCMNREVHARICGSRRVRPPPATRLWSLKRLDLIPCGRILSPSWLAAISAQTQTLRAALNLSAAAAL
jgi:hypothetical protein